MKFYIYHDFSLLKVEKVLSIDMAVKVLDESFGKVVLIKLKGGKVIRGVLHGFDQHMNLLLDSSVEIFEDGKTSDLGSIVVRGDNVVIISPPPA
jgi:small nuclear ribonucleoprotein